MRRSTFPSFPMKHRALCFLFSLLLVFCESAHADQARQVRIKTVEGLQYAPVRLAVKEGEEIELTIENHDPNDQPHNFVLIRPGTLSDIQALSLQITPEVVAAGYVPESDAVIVASGLLNPEETETIRFTAPEKKGVYPYVCTFPGHAMVMYGALYVGEKMRGNLAYDENVPELVRNREMEKLRLEMDVERPAFQRMFMPNSGPASIAVALPGKLNYCWDAGTCRLRYAWSGSFIDATRVYGGNGNALAVLMGPEFWNSGGDEQTRGIRIGGQAAEIVEFEGYSLESGAPVFRYRVDGRSIVERISSVEGALSWRFQVDGSPAEIRVFAPEEERSVVTSGVGRREGDWWIIPPDHASDFSLTIRPRSTEAQN